MPKRRRDDAEDTEDHRPVAKRQRPLHSDRLSSLSDELILRTLSFLPLPDLVLCERLSKRWRELATDGQLWKALYYDRFVRPRASRIPGIRAQGSSTVGALHYASKTARWLDDERLVRFGAHTKWKRQYKLRHNWSNGSASIKETEVADQPTTPPLLIRLHEDLIIIADKDHGLRAWSLQGEQKLITVHAFASIDGDEHVPTSLAVDANASGQQTFSLVVGFKSGAFSFYTFDRQRANFFNNFTHPASSAGEVSAIACASPFLTTITPEPRLSLYEFKPAAGTHGRMEAPRLISSMRSHTAYTPICLTLRQFASTIVASIAFAMPSYMPIWTVGIQELRLDTDGTVVDSRTAFAAMPQGRSIGEAAHGDMLSILPLPSSRPASLSYNHPYLLTAHADNTLTLYLVQSNANELIISAGLILWGHTSSVISAHVGDRGKAVSVSTRGNEVRVWELEGRGPNANLTHKAQASVRVQSEDAFDPGSSVEVTSNSLSEQAKGWVAFDDERVVLLREKMHGAQAVVVYDFT